MAVFIYSHLRTQSFFKGGHNPFVFADAALKNNRRNDFFAFAHVVKVVGYNRITDAGQDILLCVAHLCFVNQVGFGKYGTSGGNGRGMFGTERVGGDIICFNAKPFCLT